MSGLVLNLFGGPGGSCLGARDLGFDPVGVEWDGDVCATRRCAGLRTVRADVARLDPYCFAGLELNGGCRPGGYVEGVMASAPCPSFSRAGKRLGIDDLPLVYDTTRDLGLGFDRRGRGGLCRDPRSILVCEPWRWTLALRPRWVALEQVEDVLPYWRFLADGLEAIGYRTWTGILNAADYGVPQTRKRAILLASLDVRPQRPAATHADPRKGVPLYEKPWVSMAAALGWVGAVRAGRRSWWAGLVARAPRWAYEGPAPTLVTTRRSTEGALVGRQLPEGEGREVGGWKWRNGNQENAAERALDEPAPTVLFGNNLNRIEWVREHPATTVQGTPRLGRPGHKDRERGESQFAHGAVPVSLEEAAILQDFPPDYPFQGSKTKRFAQVGNAVPRGLARAYLADVTGRPVAEAEPVGAEPISRSRVA